MITQTHRLDVVPGGITTVVHVKQYQTDESLVFELFSRFGELEIAAAFTECTVRGTKSDGNGYSANATCDTSNNTVTVQLTEQMTAVAGLQPYELTVTDSTGKMITATFYLDVQRAALDADTVVSESVIREVEAVVEDYLEDHPGLFVVDPTLTQSGEAADAKATGDAIADLQSAVDDLSDSMDSITVSTDQIENGAVIWEKLSSNLKARISSNKGISGQAVDLLITILESALYTSNQSANITLLEEALLSGNSDVIYQSGETLTIDALAIDPYQSGEVLTIE